MLLYTEDQFQEAIKTYRDRGNINTISEDLFRELIEGAPEFFEELLAEGVE